MCLTARRVSRGRIRRFHRFFGQRRLDL
jgi:hypothetical protein